MSVVAELVRHQDAQVEAITVEFERLVSGGDWSLAESFLARLPSCSLQAGRHCGDASQGLNIRSETILRTFPTMTEWCQPLGDAEEAYRNAVEAILPEGVVFGGISQFTHRGRVYVAVGWESPERKWAATVPGEGSERPSVDKVAATVREVARLAAGPADAAA